MKYYAGIDLGGTFIKAAIIDEYGNLLISGKIPTQAKRQPLAIIADMADFITQLENQSAVKVCAVGIGSPGNIDSQNGVVIYNNNIGWRKVPLADEISKIKNIPVFVANDANIAALGEQYYGSGKDYKDIIFITLGTGVGGGIIIDGKLFEGYKSAGAEIGHAVIQMGGEYCSCGRRGCFEAYASATALVRQTKRAMLKAKEAGEVSQMWDLVGGDIEKVDGKTPFDGLRLHDLTAKKVIRRYTTYLSEGVINLCNEFRPQAVIIGGGISAEDIIIEKVSERVAKYIYGGMGYAPCKILKASLGNDAGFYGAVRYAVMRLSD